MSLPIPSEVLPVDGGAPETAALPEGDATPNSSAEGAGEPPSGDQAPVQPPLPKAVGAPTPKALSQAVFGGFAGSAASLLAQLPEAPPLPAPVVASTSKDVNSIEVKAGKGFSVKGFQAFLDELGAEPTTTLSVLSLTWM